MSSTASSRMSLSCCPRGRAGADWSFLHNTFIDKIQLCDGEGLVLDVSTRFKSSLPSVYERLVRMKPAGKHKTKKERAAELQALLTTQGVPDIEDDEDEEDEEADELVEKPAPKRKPKSVADKPPTTTPRKRANVFSTPPVKARRVSTPPSKGK